MKILIVALFLAGFLDIVVGIYINSIPTAIYGLGIIIIGSALYVKEKKSK